MLVEKMNYMKQLCIMLLIFITSQAALGIAIGDVSTSHLIPCNKDWFFFREKCYKDFGQTDNLSWEKASTSCSEKGGSLVTIQTKELQEFLIYSLLLHLKSNAWIGLHDQNEESQYEWSDHSIVSYTYWEPGEPSGRRNHKEDCVEMRYKAHGKIGMWNDLPCDMELPYICQSNKNEQLNNPDPKYCSAHKGGGFKYFDSCYNIVTDEKSWDDAEKYCQDSFKGHLVTILNSRAEVFLDYLLAKYNTQFWIGIKIREQSTQKWSSGWHLVFNRWSKGHKNFTKGTCGLRSDENFWTLASCGNKFSFICETNNKPPSLKKAPSGWRCPRLSKDWKDLDGDSCYIFETSKSLKWYEANYDCMSKGGALAKIRSEAESFALHAHVASTHERLLIGLHRSLDNNDIFQWVDGSDLDYENWREGEPSHHAEKCGEIWTDTMEWNDVPCNAAKGYICSVKKVPPKLEENELRENYSLQSACPSHAAEKTALGIFVSIVFISIVLGIAIYFHRIPCYGYTRH